MFGLSPFPLADLSNSFYELADLLCSSFKSGVLLTSVSLCSSLLFVSDSSLLHKLLWEYNYSFGSSIWLFFETLLSKLASSVDGFSLISFSKSWILWFVYFSCMTFCLFDWFYWLNLFENIFDSSILLSILPLVSIVLAFLGFGLDPRS